MNIKHKNGHVVIKATPEEASDMLNRIQETSTYDIPDWVDKIEVAVRDAKRHLRELYGSMKEATHDL